MSSPTAIPVRHGVNDGSGVLGKRPNLRLRDDDSSYNWLNGEGPELTRALLFVRNRAAHQLPLVVEPTGGIRAPLTFPLTVSPVVIRWVSAASLPPADERCKSPGGGPIHEVDGGAKGAGCP